MASRQPGATLQKPFYVDRDDVRHHARCAGGPGVHISWEQATKAGYEKLVAPNTLAVSYIESVLSALIDLPLPGRVAEQKIRFSQNPVYAGDVVQTKVSISSWNADSGLMTVSVECRKEEGNLPVCAGTILLNLSQ